MYYILQVFKVKKGSQEHKVPQEPQVLNSRKIAYVSVSKH